MAAKPLPDRTVSIGLIGAGGMGARHAENLHRFVGGARVAGLYEPDAERARQAALRCGSPRIFDDPRQLIEADEIEAVIIASPDPTHADFVLECLRCGKPVLCEKPLAIQAEEAARIVEAEMALGRRLVSVGFMRRFDPYHLAVQKVIQSGELGRPILYKGVHRNASIPYDVTGEVILTNSAGHDIDAARWLMRREVQEVYVRGVRSRETFSPQTQDLLLIQLGMEGGCLASIEVFVAAEYGYEVSAEVVAERGTALTTQPEPVLVRHNRSRSASVPLEWLERFQEAYVAEVIDWVDGLQTGRPFAGAGAWDGYLTLLITDACIRSLRSGLPERVPLPQAGLDPLPGRDG